MKTLNISSKGNYLVVQLDRGKANVLNQTMIDELRQLIRETEQDTTIGGIVLTGKPHFFSGGVDLLEVFYYDSEGIRNFWGSFLQLAAEMLAFSKPLVAAITGHSPAGGCILACACDYRVMAIGEKYQIGLNEMAVGIAPRESILHLYAFWIGKRKAYQYLLEGYLMKGPEALELGLVDELVDLDQTLAQAEAKIQQYLKLPPVAFRQTKKALKASLVDQMTRNFETDLELLHTQLMSDESRHIMGQVVQFLASKKK
ncbi:enoyl-CoA hydratase/isomerase family protein [Aureispira anguillae]|uniref:Enoyl-CoA hydratase/isomerase family protein n=1 Tax=Aureispira anguillae TaxID=2864201 RepID=A0A916DWR4_9BACT|nr:enoyl-CoA hydratase/isomerase family protein [Aureispira anguillae]BDS15102.1 enoyl-CoA hydratase/isomerase family protein [Aureispira anguillae]